jgi:hypothetical protein
LHIEDGTGCCLLGVQLLCFSLLLFLDNGINIPAFTSTGECLELKSYKEGLNPSFR